MRLSGSLTLLTAIYDRGGAIRAKRLPTDQLLGCTQRMTHGIGRSLRISSVAAILIDDDAAAAEAMVALNEIGRDEFSVEDATRCFR